MRQAKRAAAEGSPAVAKRATRGECMDVIRCVARLARAHPGETYWVHGVSISCSGKRRAAKPNVHKVPEMKKGEEQKKPTKPVAPKLPPTTDEDASQDFTWQEEGRCGAAQAGGRPRAGAARNAGRRCVDRPS